MTAPDAYRRLVECDRPRGDAVSQRVDQLYRERPGGARWGSRTP